MEVEQRDSYFRFMLQSHLFAKKTTGIWGTCTVCSHQPALHAVICNSAAGACFFFVYFMQIYQKGWGRVDTFLRYSSTLPWKHFSVMDVIRSVTSRTFWTSSINFLLHMHWRGLSSDGSLLTSIREWLHYTFKCLFPSRMPTWQPPVCARPNTVEETK